MVWQVWGHRSTV